LRIFSRSVTQETQVPGVPADTAVWVQILRVTDRRKSDFISRAYVRYVTLGLKGLDLGRCAELYFPYAPLSHWFEILCKDIIPGLFYYQCCAAFSLNSILVTRATVQQKRMRPNRMVMNLMVKLIFDCRMSVEELSSAVLLLWHRSSYVSVSVNNLYSTETWSISTALCVQSGNDEIRFVFSDCLKLLLLSAGSGAREPCIYCRQRCTVTPSL